MTDSRSAWTIPGAQKVAPGVHRIPLPMPGDALKAINVYALSDPDGTGGCTLIDSGWALEEARLELEKALAGIGHDLGTVDRFLITHAHRDHYTLGITVRRLLGTRVAIGAGEQGNIELSAAEGSRSALEVLLPVWGAAALAAEWDRLHPAADRNATAALYEAPDEWIEPGSRLTVGARTIEAIPTPGHTGGHLVFHDAAAGVLFTGDHVLPHITPSIGFEADRHPDPLGDFLNSLRLLLTHPDALMMPGHGPATESVHARVHELLAHHETRLEHTYAAVVGGASTAFEAARGIGWTRRNTSFDDLDAFNQLLATGETAAHLYVLVHRGRLTRSADGAGVEHHQVV